MRPVSWNLTNCQATVQKLLVWQVLKKSKLCNARCGPYLYTYRTFRGLPVGHTGEWTDRDAAWGVDSSGAKNPCIRWGFQVRGTPRCHVVIHCPLKSIEFLCGMRTKMCPNKKLCVVCCGGDAVVSYKLYFEFVDELDLQKIVYRVLW